MNIKTNLIEEYVNFVDNTKQNKKLWIFTIILVFILLIILTIITFRNKIN